MNSQARFAELVLWVVSTSGWFGTVHRKQGKGGAREKRREEESKREGGKGGRSRAKP